MLDILLKHIPNYTPFILPKWERMITDITNRQDLFVVRYLSTELGSYPNIVLIENIIKNCQDEIFQLLHIPDQFSRCVYLMEPRVRGFIEQIIDDVRSKPFHKKVFFNSLFGPNVAELIIPVMNYDPLNSLPLMNYELGVWTDVKPIRVLYYDSLEIVSSLVVDPRVRCKKDPPTVGIVTVNVVSLLLKFVNYMDNNDRKEFDGDFLRTFLKEEVFIHIHKDMIEVWLMNLINELLDCDNDKEIMELESYFKSNSLMFADFHNYFMEVIKKIQDLKNGKIKSFQLLKSKLLYNRSIVDRSKEIMGDLQVRGLRQYYHNQLCINIQDLKLMLKVLRFEPVKSSLKNIKYEMSREMRLMLKENYLHSYKSQTIRNWMRQELMEINELIELI